MGPTIVTGAAGFVGFHVARQLIKSNVEVVGVDCFTQYYDPELKKARFSQLETQAGFTAEQLDLCESAAVEQLFRHYRPHRIVHLAAQPGVRYSLSEPHAYINSNIVAFLNILEGCRHACVNHLVYASSSSVYGANTKIPFQERDRADHPVNLYGATKRANELMAYAYSHLFELPSTGLRFFTVYGPWGRPDMAVYMFTKAILEGRPIEVANAGRVWRDFTYVDDIVDGVLRVLSNPPPIPLQESNHNDPGMNPVNSSAPHRVYNIGNGHPEELNRLISLIEVAVKRKALRVEVAMPPGDIVRTHADISDLRRTLGYAPSTSLDVGIKHFIEWYFTYHKKNEGSLTSQLRASGSS